MVKSPNPPYYEILKSRRKILLFFFLVSGIGVFTSKVDLVFKDENILTSIVFLIQVIVMLLSIVGIMIIKRKMTVEREKEHKRINES
ncbi:hypothetical protein [Jeotgalibacillus marinus]|uniref:Uncharacterized protein n=1 Tax=Jeotgalibacillus marinus TaxID=86667 RepID=A0ABV3Q100_9BACL